MIPKEMWPLLAWAADTSAENTLEDEAYRLNAIHDAEEDEARLSWRTV